MKSNLQVILQSQGTLSLFCGLLLPQWLARRMTKVCIFNDSYRYSNYFEIQWLFLRFSVWVKHSAFPSDQLLQNFTCLAGKQTCPAELYITTEENVVVHWTDGLENLVWSLISNANSFSGSYKIHSGNRNWNSGCPIGNKKLEITLSPASVCRNKVWWWHPV